MQGIEKIFDDHLKYFFVRVSRITREDYHPDSMRKHFKKYSKYLLSLEEGKQGDNLHIQGVIASDQDELTSDQVKADLKEYFKSDGIGNAFLYCKPCKDRKQAIKYNLKEGCFIYKGFTKKFIEDMVKCSIKKEKLKQKLDKLYEDLMINKIKFQKYCITYLDILVAHGKNIYVSHLKAKFNRVAIASGYVSSTEFYVKHFSEDFGTPDDYEPPWVKDEPIEFEESNF